MVCGWCVAVLTIAWGVVVTVLTAGWWRGSSLVGPYREALLEVRHGSRVILVRHWWFTSWSMIIYCNIFFLNISNRDCFCIFYCVFVLVYAFVFVAQNFHLIRVISRGLFWWMSN
jgi:hypothetical protein